VVSQNLQYDVPKSASSISEAREFKKGLDLGLGAVAGGDIAVHIESVRVPVCQVPGQCGFGAEGLGKKDRGDIRVAEFFQALVVRGLVFHTAGPAVDMGSVGEEAEQGKITGRYPPESGCGGAGRQVLVRPGRLHRPGDGADFVEQWHPAGAEGSAKIFFVLIPGCGDDCLRQDILEDGGGMQSAVAFPRAHIDIDTIRFQADRIDNHGAQDGAEYSGQIGRGYLNISFDDGLIQVKDCIAICF